MANSDPGPSLPTDQYAHAFAPVEWWWHTGTLLAEGNRVFGFEINAASFSQDLVQFTETMITDVKAKAHYQTTTVALPFDIAYAETDPAKPWYVRLGGAPGANGAVEMRAPQGKIMPMSVITTFQDDITKTPCSLNLMMMQEPGDAPMMVWGTGVKENVNPDGKTPLARNNYYYSFTKLHTVGQLRIGGETLQVHGTTWMDHEYGAWHHGQKWLLQDMQLNNGVHISSFFATPPVLNQPSQSLATILWPDGRSTFHNSVTTPKGPVWTSPAGVPFCMTMEIQILEPEATLIVTTHSQDQAFSPGLLYEGRAVVNGTFMGARVSGNAWNEQSLSRPSAFARLLGKGAPAT